MKTYLPNPILSDKYVYGYENFDICEWYRNITKDALYPQYLDIVAQIAEKHNIKIQFIFSLLESQFNVFSFALAKTPFATLNPEVFQYLETYCNTLSIERITDRVRIYNDIDNCSMEVEPKNRATSNILQMHEKLSEVLWLYNKYGKMF